MLTRSIFKEIANKEFRVLQARRRSEHPKLMRNHLHSRLVCETSSLVSGANIGRQHSGVR